MQIAGAAHFGLGAARALVFAASDAFGDLTRGSLPRTREWLARPGVVSALMREHAPADVTPLPRVANVTLPGVDFESSNCTNFLIGLEFDPKEAEAYGDRLPRTAYVKLPCEELATRVFANTLGFWAQECHFCERIASKVPIRVPRVYAVAQQGARFVLLLENLHETPGTRLFLNRDMAAGTTPERARAVLSMLAELHAGFWGSGSAERAALLPPRLHMFLDPRLVAMSRFLNAASVEACHRKAPEVFSEALVRTYRLANKKWEALSRAWYTDGPLTLVHGDSHLGNVFEYPGVDGPRMGMIDFQAVHWSKGMRDVQYFLINSLEPDVLAAHEEPLIEHYCAELSRHGVDLEPRDALVQHRAFSFQTLMTAVTSHGLGSLIERNHTVETVLRRSCAATERLDFAGWLASL